MRHSIGIGTTATIDREVTDEYCTTRGEHRIFSTPDLVVLVEATAIRALEPVLGEGQDSVGSHVAISHGAPSLKGQVVSATTTVSQVDRRRVVFDVEVRDGLDTVSTGTHERFVVDLDTFDVRLREKADKVAGA